MNIFLTALLLACTTADRVARLAYGGARVQNATDAELRAAGYVFVLSARAYFHRCDARFGFDAAKGAAWPVYTRRADGKHRIVSQDYALRIGRALRAELNAAIASDRQGWGVPA